MSKLAPLLVAALCLGCGAAKTAVDAAAAIGSLAESDREWENFQNEKAMEARSGYEAGLQTHERYMTAKLPAKADIGAADAWYQQITRVMEKIDIDFKPVWHSMFHDKILMAEARMGEGWEKLSLELAGLYEKGLDEHPEKDTLIANLNQALLNAVTYYQRVAEDYTTEHPAVAARHKDWVALATERGAKLKAMRAALPK